MVLLGAVLAPAAAAVVFFAAAFLTDSIPLMAGAALAAAAAVCAPTLRARSGRRTRMAAPLTAAALAAAVLLAAALAVFRPIDTERPRTGEGGGGYWELPTGSRIAHWGVPAVGDALDTPVIRLHGGPGTPGDGPDGLDLALAGLGYDVHGYDQVGSGRSERLDDPGEYTVERQVADLEGIRVEIGAERVVLIGGSWGASLGAAYAAAHPERVAALVFASPGVLWAPAWEGRDEGDLWDRLTPEQERAMDDLEARGGARLLAWSLLMEIDPGAARALVPDDEIDAVFAELVGIAGPAAACDPGRAVPIPEVAPGFYANQMVSRDQFIAPDPRPALRGLDVPVLVLRGECDYKHWEIAREYRDVFPRATLVYFPGAGHAIELDRPEPYVETVTAFLTGGDLPLPAYTGDGDPAR